MTESQTPLLAALQAAVAGEQAAIWACGRAAAELTGRREEALRELDSHRRAREQLRSQVVALGAEPVAAAVAYAEPFPISGPGTARQLLAHVNRALAATYADLAAANEPEQRARAIARCSQAATRAVTWGARWQAFPGTR